MKNDYKLNQDGITVGDQVYMYSAIDSIKIDEKFYVLTVVLALLSLFSFIGLVTTFNLAGLFWGVAFALASVGYQLWRKKIYLVKIVIGTRGFKIARFENKAEAEMLQDEIKKQIQSLKK